MRLLLLLALACGGTAPPQAPPSPPPVQTAAAPALDHVVWTAPGHDPAAPASLVIALHGLGDEPERFVALYHGLRGPVRVVAPRAPIPWTRGSSWLRAHGRTGDPELLAEDLRARVTDVLALIDEVTAAHPTVGRPVITGFSQGAMVSYAVALRAPERVAGAVPIAGALVRPLLPSGPPPAPVRIHALHGTADEVLPYAPVAVAVEALRMQGWDVTLRAWEGVGHRVTPEMRHDVEVTVSAMLEAERARVAAGAGRP